MKTEKTYHWDASDYASHSKAQLGWAKELIDKLQLAGNESVLDIGCGDGKVTAEISGYLKDGSVVGIDNSAKMLSLAKEKFPPGIYPNLSFLKEDTRSLPFIKDFDVVFSNAVLHWVLDHKPVLKGIHQSLKPGGRAIVQMGGKGNGERVAEVLNDVMKRNKWEMYFNNFVFPYGFYSPDEYEPWLKDAGFEIIALELKPKDMVHETPEEFKGWFRTTWLPYTQRIPSTLRSEFVDLVVDEYCETVCDRDGKLHTTMQRLEYIAVKMQ